MRLEHTFGDGENRVAKTLDLIDEVKAGKGEKPEAKTEAHSAEEVLREVPVKSRVIPSGVDTKSAEAALAKQVREVSTGNANKAADNWQEKRASTAENKNPEEALPKRSVETTITNKQTNPAQALNDLFNEADELRHKK